MGTIADKLNATLASKNAIRDAITEKTGENAGEVMSSYAEKIMSIKSTLVEKVQISVKTNQSTDNDLNGVNITISYGDYSETRIWDGNPFEVSIPAYAPYAITYGTIDGYLAPQPNEYTAEAGFVRTVTAQYNTEVVTVIVSVNDNTSVAGRTVTINGESLILDASGVVSKKIPYDTVYSVSVNDLAGYMAPAEQKYTANNPSRTINMQYTKIVLGVCIQDTTGKLWKRSEWDGSAKANCIAVFSSSHYFGITLDFNKASLPMDSNASASSLSLSGFATAADAYNSYSGKSNTQSIVSAYGYSSSEVAGYCVNYKAPNGKSGYLGSVGEWMIVFNNLQEINDCLSLASAAPIVAGSYYWSSTRRSPDYNGKSLFYCLVPGSAEWTYSIGNETWVYTRAFVEV